MASASDTGRLVAVVHLAAVLAPPQPVLEFADRRFEGGVEAVGAGLASHYRSAAPRGDLHVLTVLALAPVALVVEFDIEEVDAAVESLEAREFLRDVDAEVVGDLDVAALDDDLGAGRGRGLCRLQRSSSGRFPWNGLTCLATRFCFASHAHCVPAWQKMHRRGTRRFAARRCKVSISHLLPLGDGWRCGSERRREVFTDVGPDGSPCSPTSASEFRHLFSVLHAGLISTEIGRAVRLGGQAFARVSTAATRDPERLQNTYRFGRGRAGGDDVVDQQHVA